jgi:hypothetical protein
MEGEGDKWQQCKEDMALNIPFLMAEHEGSQISGNSPSNNVTTSFMKTCFNGLNALSGNLINFSCFVLQNTRCVFQ